MASDVVTTTDSSSVGVQQIDQQPEIVVENFTGKQRDNWLKQEHDFPSKKAAKEEKSPISKQVVVAETKEEESSTSETVEEPETAEKEAEPAPAVKTQEAARKFSPAEARIKELLAESKVLKARLERLEKPAPQEPKAVAEKAEPKAEDYETVDAYLKALTDHRVSEAIKLDRQERAQEAQKAEFEARQKETIDKWNNRTVEARKKHADYDEVALDPDLPIAEGSVLDHWVLESDLGAEVLYYYGQNPEELGKLNAMKPIAAAREIARVEFSILNPKEEAESKPAKAKVPQAPPPPSEVSTRGAMDPIAAALANGDFATYARLKNAEERGSRK